MKDLLRTQVLDPNHPLAVISVHSPQERVMAPAHLGPKVDLWVLLLERWQNLFHKQPGTSGAATPVTVRYHQPL
eukprot:CAMPEP_0206150886 /NCGR_PEP_ID=MMETSP1473-20131121/38539_1 /ASSEMBLY_ACC=CAM_ASM_001109 /TAXON_ID=1461547 /ORGANISM="Stichococcus sp, Strain RCC1054" /LENGTH=73 /DNA_ID=CAMNT_0053548417 /DNA_START=693 /DNA_END=914 /DNA_ORIENTATION=+